MTRGLKTAVAVIAAAVLLAGAAVALAGVRAADRPGPVVGPLAAVLTVSGHGSDLVVADVGAMRVVRTIHLRSLATDAAFDAASGLVVTAQAGGVGDGADDVVGEVDARAGDVRYVRLGCPNPGNVACVAGRAYVLHGMVDPKGMVVTRVDVAHARVDGTTHVPEGPGIWSAGAGAVWTAGRPSGTAPEVVLRMSASDLSTSAVCPADGLNGIVPEPGGSLLLLRGGGASGSPAAIARVSASGSMMASGAPAGLRHGAQSAVSVGGVIAVGDWSGASPESRVLAVVDARTLAASGTIAIDGAPCSMAACGDSLLVADRAGGRLLVVDPATRHTIGSIGLGARDLVFAKVVTLGEGGPS